MKTKSKAHLARLREIYKNHEDEDSLSLLDDAERTDEEIRQLRIFKEHPLTEKLIRDMYQRLRLAYVKLTTDSNMSEVDRKGYFISIDWAKWFLDTVGEDPDKVEAELDEMIAGYAKRAGI